MRKVPQSYNAEIYYSAILRVFTLRFSAVRFYSFETASSTCVLYIIKKENDYNPASLFIAADNPGPSLAYVFRQLHQQLV